MRVKIEDIVGELDGQPDDWRSFLDVKTGEIVGVTVEELRAAEEERLDQFPAGQENVINMAAEILDQDRFLPLPTSYKVHEYGIMERYCLSLENDRLSEIMSKAIRGSGAFRRFKDTIERYGLAEDWYAFRAEALREIAVEWCGDNGIEYE
ncbi:MAG: UPF0158 family protein [Peptococcaceae bacterium]|nr:UPF0158 family protein [Peptococcaceae bacterium]